MAPPGYEKLKIPTIKNLEDKEVYLVQVPRDFDAKKAEFKSNTEVVCEGKSYFVSSGGNLTDCEILNETTEGTLKPSSVELDGLLSFTTRVALPKVDYEEAIQPKPRVPQLKNLRMRHFPTGYGPESYGIDVTKVAKAKKPSTSTDSQEKESAEEKKGKSKKKSSEHTHKEHKSKHKHNLDLDHESEKPAKRHKKNSDEKAKKKSKKHEA